MHMHSQLQIKTKLFIGFGLIIVAAVGVAVTALFAISSLSSSVNDLVGTRIPQLQRAAMINEAIRSSAQAINDAYLVDGAEQVRAELEATASNRKSTNEAMDKLKSSLATDREKELFGNIVTKRTPYVTERDHIIQLVRDGKREEAHREFITIKPLRRDFLAALKALDDHVQEQAQQEGTETAHRAKTARLLIFVLVAAAPFASFLVALWVIGSIAKPLGAAVQTANRIAERDLTVRVEGAGGTETGQLMAAMQAMAGNLKEVVAQAAEMSTSIASVSSGLNATSERIANATEQVAGQTHTVATASQEMSATSNDIAQNCQEAALSSRQATAAAESGAKVVAHTVEMMNRIATRVNATASAVASLGSRSDQIGEIVGTIEDIADQTNLLALNAAIEAARAGEQGRGFAVVADEVRALAQRTAKATGEIGAMIKAIQTETQQAVAAMEEGVREVHLGTEEAAKSGDALHEILEQTNSLSLQVSQIATAAEEQTATIGEITGNIHRISDLVEQAARGSHESAHSASQLASLSERLNVLVRQFKLS
jgi:methyl-accepting chemotaxis protein